MLITSSERIEELSLSTHQFNPDILTDDHFLMGHLRYLVVGNQCRLLDNRRTSGFIRAIDLNSGYFKWQITEYEDKGQYWEVEFENISNFQFKKESLKNDFHFLKILENKMTELNIIKKIDVNEIENRKTIFQIEEISLEIDTWLVKNSVFLKSNLKINFQSLMGPVELQNDFKNYMLSVDLWEIEVKTAESQVLNPYSGEWIRAMQMTMAEMGLKEFAGKAIRSIDSFMGLGSKDGRRKYILHRLAFVRSLFKILDISEVELYRGMSTEGSWNQKNEPRFWSSWTFNFQVAQDFSNLQPLSKFKNSYIVKRAMPINQIFMTYLETQAMNNQYKEAEAIVLHDPSDAIFW